MRGNPFLFFWRFLGRECSDDCPLSLSSTTCNDPLFGLHDIGESNDGEELPADVFVVTIWLLGL